MPASSLGGSEVLEIAGDRRTLLDVILESSKSTGQTSRLVYAATLVHRDNSAEPYAEWVEKVVNAAAGNQVDEVTGMMVVYPTCLLHCVEAPPRLMQCITQQLGAADPAATNIAGTRVLLCTEACPQRLFAARLAAFVSGSASAEAAEGCPDGPSFVAAAGQVVKAYLAMGSAMAGLPEVALQQHLESLPAYHPEVPSADTAAMLAASKVAPSLDQHLHTYTTAHNLPLARERCWPAPPSIPDFLVDCEARAEGGQA